MYHVFRARIGSEVAITDDETGIKLPTRQGAWAYLRPIEINSTDGSRIGANSHDIVSGVKQNGYFILPVTYEGKTAN
jgi:hypothetical protein